MHQRQVIVNRVVERLMGKTAAEERVLSEYDFTIRQKKLPLIVVEPQEEPIDVELARHTNPVEIRRDLSLSVQCWVSPGEGARARQNAMSAEVEAVLYADPSLGGEVQWFTPESTDFAVVDDGQLQLALVVLNFAVQYSTYHPEAVEGLDEFLKAGVTTTIDGQSTEMIVQVRPHPPSGPLESLSPLASRMMFGRDDVTFYLDAVGVYMLPT